MATTRLPAFHAALAVPAPILLLAPVMHQTLSTVVLLATVSFADQALLQEPVKRLAPLGRIADVIPQIETYLSTVLTSGIPFLLRKVFQIC